MTEIYRYKKIFMAGDTTKMPQEWSRGVRGMGREEEERERAEVSHSKKGQL